MCSVSGHIFFLDLKKKKKERKKLRPGIDLEPTVIYQNKHLHRAFKGDPAVNWNQAIIWSFMVFNLSDI